MRVMVLVKATAWSEKGLDLKAPEFQQLMQDMGKFNEALQKAGDAYLEELVKIAGRNRQKLYALQKGIG